MGSVGTTVSAAEADTASTDIIMLSEDSGNDSEDAEKPEEELDSAKETTIESTEASSDLTAADSEHTDNAAPSAEADPVPDEVPEETEAASQEEAETQPAIEAETHEKENVTESAAAAEEPVPEDTQDPVTPEEDLSFTVQGLELSTQDLKADEKTAPTITITTVVEAVNIENIANRVADALTWESSDSTVAVVKAVTGAVVSEGEEEPANEPSPAEETTPGQDSPATAPAEPVQCVVALTVKVSARKEGTAALTFSIGEQTAGR